MSIIQQLFKQSIIYSVGSASMQLANFLLMPLYARYLSPDEFGVQAMLIILVSILNICLDLGIKTSVNRVYYDYQTDHKKRIFMGNAFLFTHFFGFVLVTICYLAEEKITYLLTGSTDHLFIFRLIICSVFLNSSFQLYMTFLRIKNKPLKYVFFALGKLFSLLGITIFLVAWQGHGLKGVFEADLITSSLLYFIILIPVVKSIKISVNTEMLKNMLHVGLPFVPAGIFSFILASSDRYLLKMFLNLHDVGLYAMGYRFGLIINVFVVQPFVLAWPQHIVPISQKKNADKLFGRIATYFMAVCGTIILFLLVFLDEIYSLILTPEYYVSKNVVPLVAAAYMFYGLYYIALVGIFLSKKTKYPPIIIALSGILNVCLNLYVIPKWGMLGAAYTTFLTYLIIPIMTYHYSKKLFPICIEYRRIALLILSLTTAYTVCKIDMQTGLLGQLLFKLSIIALCPIMLYFTGFFTQNEKEHFMALILPGSKPGV